MESTYIGVDLGGTKVLAARVSTTEILEIEHRILPKDNGDSNVVVQLLIDVISSLINNSVQAIGLGVPGIVDHRTGIVYDVQNIPSWKEVHLTEILSEHFKIPVHLNNDANCYALGEAYYGLGRNCDYLVGLTVGTGLGGGIVYKGKLFDDASGVSGEFGIIPYLDSDLEAYCSGGFFSDHYGINGVEAARIAREGDQKYIEAFNQYGRHLGNALKIILSTLDPARIIIGGSVAQSHGLFEKSMWESLNDFPFQRSLQKISIEFSETNNMGVLGASSLCFQNAR